MKGYTFIELLVVISISAILFFFSYSAYQTFNKAQAVKNGAAEVKSTIRDAQNKAISGEKIKDSAHFCDLSTISLLSWNFIWPGTDNTTYKIAGKFNTTTGVKSCGEKIYYLPKTDNIHFTNSGEIAFRAVAQVVDLSLASQPVCLKGDSSAYYKITVSKGGDINVVQKVANCP